MSSFFPRVPRECFPPAVATYLRRRTLADTFVWIAMFGLGVVVGSPPSTVPLWGVLIIYASALSALVLLLSANLAYIGASRRDV